MIYGYARCSTNESKRTMVMFFSEKCHTIKTYDVDFGVSFGRIIIQYRNGGIDCFLCCTVCFFSSNDIFSRHTVGNAISDGEITLHSCSVCVCRIDEQQNQYD